MPHPADAAAPPLQVLPQHVVRKGRGAAVVDLLARLMAKHRETNAIFMNVCICLAALALQEGPSFEQLTQEVGGRGGPWGRQRVVEGRLFREGLVVGRDGVAGAQHAERAAATGLPVSARHVAHQPSLPLPFRTCACFRTCCT